jgi:uncharacterized protein
MSTSTRRAVGSAPETSGVRHGRGPIWSWMAALEALLACAAVLRDMLIPSLALLAMAAVSLGVRRQGLGSLGLHRVPARPLALKMFVFALVWSVFQLAVTMPIANHVSGSKQDLSGFADIEGNPLVLLAFLGLGWALGAFAEELAYRGYLLTRVRQALGSGRTATVVAVLVTSVLFGLVHSEQGAIGVVVVTLDALAFSVLRYRFRSVWPSILAHGFNNTIGFIAFFFVGPIYGLW